MQTVQRTFSQRELAKLQDTTQSKKAMLCLVLGIFVFLIIPSAYSNEHEAAHVGIPWDTIQKQIFNFVLVLGALTYFLRSKVVTYCTERASGFEKAAIFAKKAKEDAENKKHELKLRLESLQATAANSVDQARREAEAMKAKLKAEAEHVAQQIRSETEQTIKREIETAMNDLKTELLKGSMSQAREDMKTSVREPDQTRLQNEFVEKIQVVR